MNPYQSHADAMTRVQTFLGASCPQFNWDGENWPIVPGSARLKKDLTPGGFSLMYDLRFNVTLAEFQPTFATADALKTAMLETPFTYQGESWKIQVVTIHPGGLSLTVEANSLNQGA